MITNFEELISNPRQLQEKIENGVQNVKVNLAYNSGSFRDKSSNKIKTIAYALKVKFNLKYDSDFFKPKSIKMIETIAHAVKGNKITSLTLYFDQLNNKNAELISKMLKDKTLLTHLIIYSSKTSQNEAVGVLLENNFTLTQFNLMNPYCFDNLVIHEIAEALKNNTTLLNLYLGSYDFSSYNSSNGNNLEIIKQYLNRNRQERYNFIEKKIKLSEEQQGTDLSLLYEDIQNDIARLPENFPSRNELYLIYINSLVTKYQGYGNFGNALHCLYDAMIEFPEIQEYKVMLSEIIFSLPKPLFQNRLDDYRLIYLLMHYISDHSLLKSRETLLKSVVRQLKLPNDTMDAPTSASFASLQGGELCTIDQFIEKKKPTDKLIFEHFFEDFIKTDATIYEKPDYSQLDLKKLADDFRTSKNDLMKKFKERIIIHEEIDQNATINDNQTGVTTVDQHQNFETNNDKPSSSTNQYRYFYTSQNEKVATNNISTETGESFKACK
jgi:hypothetical protein